MAEQSTWFCKGCFKINLSELHFRGDYRLFHRCHHCRKVEPFSGPIFDSTDNLTDYLTTQLRDNIENCQPDNADNTDDAVNSEKCTGGISVMGLVVVKRTVADNPRDIALKIKEAIMSADGYSYRLQATSHQTIATRYTFYCSQNSKLTTYKRPKENPTRRRHPPTRFDCHGGLTVFVPTDPHSLYCGFKYEHGRFHPRVKNRKVSEPLKEYIQSNLELTAKDIYAKFKKIKDQFPKDQHISQAQVYYWWHEFRGGRMRQVKKKVVLESTLSHYSSVESNL